MRGAGAFARWTAPWLLLLCSAAWAEGSDEFPAPGEAATVLSAEEPATEAAAATEAAEAAPPEREIARGIASWYGGRFHGRPTASGEPFDMHALTAAHPTLPFGTLVQVRSLVNGRSVEVRINDRGPFAGRRIIDLSRAAALVLGLIQSGAGIKPVRLSVLDEHAAGATERTRREVSARRSSRPRDH